MNPLALVSVVAGAVIIAVRGPFVIAPAASSAAGRWLIASRARIRVAGVIFAALGLAMILSAHGSTPRSVGAKMIQMSAERPPEQ